MTQPGPLPPAPPPQQAGQPAPTPASRAAKLAGALFLLIGAAYTVVAGGIIVTAGGAFLAVQIEQALIAAGVSMPIAAFIARYAANPPARQSPFPPGPAEYTVWRQVSWYRSWYIVNAVHRLERAERKGTLSDAEVKEVRYFQWHLRAVDRRVWAAGQVDALAAGRRPEPNGRVLLGWAAVLDARTTPDCRAANGRNFYTDRPPAIGWPGAVHPHCRCRAVGPWPGGPVMR